MAVTLNASSVAGLITTADTSTILQLQTNGTAAVTVDASQNVLIGATTNTAGNRLAVVGSGIQLSAGTTAQEGIRITRATGIAQINGINNDNNAYNAISFATGASEAMRILTTGNILCLSGGSTSATGTGIAFPATQSASSDANTLDDYEEGTWTPVLVPTSGSITTQTNTGAYTKIGRQVTVNFLCIIDNVGTATALSSMSGLPFASSSAVGVGAGRETSITGLMWQWIGGGGSSSLFGWTYANNSAIATGYTLRGTLTYFV